MNIAMPTQLTIEQGNRRLVDLTSKGVTLRDANGVDREDALNLSPDPIPDGCGGVGGGWGDSPE